MLIVLATAQTTRNRNQIWTVCNYVKRKVTQSSTIYMEDGRRVVSLLTRNIVEYTLSADEKKRTKIGISKIPLPALSMYAR